MNMENKKESLADLIKRGGIYRDLKGSNKRDVLSSLTGALVPLVSVPAETLLEAVLEREALMSTSIGNGIALPHPRNPLIESDNEQFAALAFLEQGVDWTSMDGSRVDTLILIVSASARQHLHLLSEINFFCRQEEFLRLLKERASLEELLDFIRETEKNWK